MGQNKEREKKGTLKCVREGQGVEGYDEKQLTFNFQRCLIPKTKL